MNNGRKIISFQGFAGAYSDMACRAVFPSWQTMPCDSFEAAFDAVQQGKADRAMIPVDNSLAGRVADVHHLLPAGKLFIVGETFLSIRHYLLGVKGATTADLKHVHSHIHAIPQCRTLIKKRELQSHVAADTAGAAAHVAEMNDPAHAAIASELAANLYGLEILEANIQDEDHNTTRFLILSGTEDKPDLSEKDDFLTSIVFRTRNIPAALYKALGGFATNGVGLAKLESYVGEGLQVAQFYVEAESHIDAVSFQLALEELNFFAQDVRILGCYRADNFRKK